MRLYKGTYKDRDRKKQPTKKWYGEIRVNGRPRRMPLFTDRVASQDFLSHLAKYQLFRVEGLDDRLREWVRSIQPVMAETLVDMGLIDSAHVKTAQPLNERVLEYEKFLGKTMNRKPRHVAWTVSQIRKIIEDCNFCHWTDISLSRFETFVGDLRGQCLKARSINGYTVAFKGFLNWSISRTRAVVSDSIYAILAMKPLNNDVDATERRALSVEEMRVLLDFTMTAPTRFGMTGAERALLYRLGVETGLRAGELQSLTRGSFNLKRDRNHAAQESIKLTADPASVMILARDAKNKKTDHLYLSDELAAYLVKHLEKKAKGEPAFNVPDHTHTAEMFRADYNGARAAWIAAAPEGADRDDRKGTSFLAETDDLDRPLVFHCLRHTCGVWAFEYKRMMPKEVQALMRVSSLKLVERYTKSFNVNLKDRANLIPSLSPAQTAPVTKTGTEG